MVQVTEDQKPLVAQPVGQVGVSVAIGVDDGAVLEELALSTTLDDLGWNTVDVEQEWCAVGRIVRGIDDGLFAVLSGALAPHLADVVAVLSEHLDELPVDGDHDRFDSLADLGVVQLGVERAVGAQQFLASDLHRSEVIGEAELPLEAVE